MDILKKLDAFLNKVEGAITIILLLVMLVLGFWQVVLRNVFSGGLVWGDVLLRHLVLWIGFFGATLAASQERHISIDAISRFLPPRFRSGLHVITNLFSAVICYFFFRAAVTFIGFEVESRHTVYGEIPALYAEIVIPVGFGLLVVHFLLRMVVRADEALEGRAAA